MSQDLAFVRRLVTGRDLAPVDGLDALRTHLASLDVQDSVERAALGGRAATALGWAFASGYVAALGRLAPGLGGGLAALCASETGGPQPKAILSTLTPRAAGGWELSGEKSFVTLGAHCEHLVVVARTGLDAQGRPSLRAACIPSRREGLAFEACPALPFAPEIDHARIRMQAVVVQDDELLPGDGYDDVLKPFRTIEDTHVLAAAVGYGVRVARESAWDAVWVEQAASCIASLRAVGAAPARAPETHLTLAGALAQARRLLDEGAWSSAPEATRLAWERDRRLLDVARAAREARTAAAWRGLPTDP